MMTSKLRSLILPALLTLIAGALLIGLGAWQLHRMAWKDAIIAKIDARTKAAPQPLPPKDAWVGLAPDDYEYRHVALDGTFENDRETLVYRGGDEGPGFLVMTPLKLASGGSVIVNRGYIPEAMKDKAKRTAPAPQGLAHLTGLMRQPEPRNLFTPPDEPAKGQFFTRDPELIAKHAGLKDAAPFTVDADPSANLAALPHGGATELAIPNNHFSYALTWFGLALGLFGVFASFAWRRLSTDRPASEADGTILSQDARSPRGDSCYTQT